MIPLYGRKRRRKWTVRLLIVCVIVSSAQAFLLQQHCRARNQALLASDFAGSNSTEDPGALERYRKRQLRRQRQGNKPPQRRRATIQSTAFQQRITFLGEDEEEEEEEELVIPFLAKNDERNVIKKEERNASSSWQISRNTSAFNMSSIRKEEDPPRQYEEQIDSTPPQFESSDESSPPLIVHTSPPDMTRRPSNPPSSSFLFGPPQQQRTRWQRVFQTTKILAKVPHTLKQKARGTIHRTVKRILRVQREDEIIEATPVQDVEYQYVRRDPMDDPVDVQTVVPAVDKERGEEQKVSRQPAPYSMNATIIALAQDQQQSRRRRPIPSQLKSASPKHQKRRRIYNPYTNSEDDMDTVDRIGKFVADTVDQFLWGQYDTPTDDDVSSNSPPRRPARKRQRNSRPTSQENKYNKTGHSTQHWKDRLEERFDSIMGIHKDGDVYNRWFQAEGEEENAPARRKPSGVNKNRPFWEEEGSLIALLLGRSKNGLSWEKALTPRGGDGSLVTIFRTVLQTAMVLAGYAFRWASVRGALPQPMVVLGVSAAGLCVRQHRVRAMLLALILFRTIGELVHGGLYGQDGWEDDTSETDNDEIKVVMNAQIERPIFEAGVDAVRIRAGYSAKIVAQGTGHRAAIIATKTQALYNAKVPTYENDLKALRQVQEELRRLGVEEAGPARKRARTDGEVIVIE